MGKTRDFFKEIIDLRVRQIYLFFINFSEEIKKKWQEYTEELYKKCLNDLDNHNGVISHLEPDILECKVSGPQKASGSGWGTRVYYGGFMLMYGRTNTVL